uniref:DRBM domain-containing protein n=1 Tax=Parascaris equorum TaxID=6256 RepID=A0A914S529_PAREQ
MGDDIKGWLYGWLGKKKLGTPTYNITANTGRARARFKCELRVTGQPHIGLGVSVNKKDAATNAARDFAQFLIRQKMLDPSEMPALTVYVYLLHLFIAPLRGTYHFVLSSDEFLSITMSTRRVLMPFFIHIFFGFHLPKFAAENTPQNPEAVDTYIADGIFNRICYDDTVFEASSLEATNIELKPGGWNDQSHGGDSSSKTSFFGCSSNMDRATGSGIISAVSAAYIAPPKPKTEHEKYVAQRAEEVAQVREV